MSKSPVRRSPARAAVAASPLGQKKTPIKSATGTNAQSSTMDALAKLADINSDLDQGKLIFARVKGHPWWPAQVIPDSAREEHCGKFKRSVHATLAVQFFGTGEFGWIRPEDTKTWVDGIPLAQKTKHKRFAQALEQIEEVLNNKCDPTAYPDGWWCKPEEEEESEEEEEEEEEKPKVNSKGKSASQKEGLDAKSNSKSGQKRKRAEAQDKAGKKQKQTAKTDKTDAKAGKKRETGSEKKTKQKVDGEPASKKPKPTAPKEAGGKTLRKEKKEGQSDSARDPDAPKEHTGKPATAPKGRVKALKPPRFQHLNVSQYVTAKKPRGIPRCDVVVCDCSPGIPMPHIELPRTTFVPAPRNTSPVSVPPPPTPPPEASTTALQDRDHDDAVNPQEAAKQDAAAAAAQDCTEQKLGPPDVETGAGCDHQGPEDAAMDASACGVGRRGVDSLEAPAGVLDEDVAAHAAIAEPDTAGGMETADRAMAEGQSHAQQDDEAGTMKEGAPEDATMAEASNKEEQESMQGEDGVVDGAAAEASAAMPQEGGEGQAMVETKLAMQGKDGTVEGITADASAAEDAAPEASATEGAAPEASTAGPKERGQRQAMVEKELSAHQMAANIEKEATKGGWRRTGCGEECLNRQMMFFCDPKLCPAGNTCSNRPFDRLTPPKLKVVLTENRGWGAIALEPIKAGSFVVEYIGELLDDASCEQRLWECKKVNEDNFYLMEISKDVVIDARLKGNTSRFLNSSCDPNCATQKWTDSRTGEVRVGIFSIKDVEVGEELTYDYCFMHFGFSESATSFSCMCGAANCRGTLDAAPEKHKNYGSKIEILWDDGVFYMGEVAKYDHKADTYTIIYEDGDEENLKLSTVSHKWVTGPLAGQVFKASGKKKRSQSSAKAKPRNRPKLAKSPQKKAPK